MHSGRLVPDPMVAEVVEERLTEPDCRHGCVLDGFPRTTAQAEQFDDWAAKSYLPVSVAVVIEVDEETLFGRLADRGRQDDDREVIHERFRQYESLTMPLLEYYSEHDILKCIDGVGDMDEVFQRILQAVENTES